jgi:hypothetical protein
MLQGGMTMAGDLFPSPEAAIDDAKKHYRAEFGDRAKFMEHSLPKVPASGFQVVDLLMNNLGAFGVKKVTDGWTWQEIPLPKS